MNPEEMMKMMQQMMGGASGAGSLMGGVGALGGIAGMAVPGLPLAIGGLDLISGLIKQHKANQAKQTLNQPDPELQKYMGEIDRQRKSFESGSAYGSEMKELKNQESATQEGVLRAGRGNTGSTLQALERVGQNTGMQYGKITAQGEQRQDEFTKMYGDLIGRLEQRKYEQNMDTFNQSNIDARDSKIKGLQTLLNTAGLSGKLGGAQMPDFMTMMQRMMGQREGNVGLGGGTQELNPITPQLFQPQSTLQVQNANY